MCTVVQFVAGALTVDGCSASTVSIEVYKSVARSSGSSTAVFVARRTSRLSIFGRSSRNTAYSGGAAVMTVIVPCCPYFTPATIRSCGALPPGHRFDDDPCVALGVDAHPTAAITRPSR
jgi:hypothetical protein